jgi:hypothetical protein
VGDERWVRVGTNVPSQPVVDVVVLNGSVKCTAAADCCGAAQGYECINGFCARPTAQ